jgi:hypothetical protein
MRYLGIEGRLKKAACEGAETNNERQRTSTNINEHQRVEPECNGQRMDFLYRFLISKILCAATCFYKMVQLPPARDWNIHNR